MHRRGVCLHQKGNISKHHTFIAHENLKSYYLQCSSPISDNLSMMSSLPTITKREILKATKRFVASNIN